MGRPVSTDVFAQEHILAEYNFAATCCRLTVAANSWIADFRAA
jgi:hypothetical protein